MIAADEVFEGNTVLLACATGSSRDSQRSIRIFERVSINWGPER